MNSPFTINPAIVIVNYNTAHPLQCCLASLGPADEVVVVDNDSTDESVALVRRNFPHVRVIASPNNGYGAGANLGVGVVSAENILILNSDTLLSPNTLPTLNAHLNAHPRCALVGPRLLNPDGTLQPSCYPFPTLFPLFLQETTLERLTHFLPYKTWRTWKHDTPQVVPWVLGAAFAIRRTAFESVGGFDPGYFLYMEETDLAYRLQKAGWETHFTPHTTITHTGGASTQQHPTASSAHYIRSLTRFYRYHYSPLRQALLAHMLRAILWTRKQVRPTP